MDEAVAMTSKPTLIRLRTVIAWPAPKARNTAKSHGSALGSDEVAAAKIELGLPAQDFYFPSDVADHARRVAVRGKELRSAWNKEFESWKTRNPERAALLSRLMARTLPDGWDSALPEYPVDKDVATRKASGDVINALARLLPELFGGSSDLADSNNTTIEGGGSFLPASSTMKNANPYEIGRAHV